MKSFKAAQYCTYVTCIAEIPCVRIIRLESLAASYDVIDSI
jgi:hypothetical protein